jgi:hypothetical protein
VSASETICRAIGKRRLLSFVYKGSVRTVEPYILGYEEGGGLTLSAVQVLGSSGKGFRSFSVEGISALVMSDRHFQRDHPDYNPRDRFFAQVICQI